MDPSTPASSVEDLDRSDRIVEGIALSLVLFISLFLNAAVIWIVLKHKTLRSKPANIFVANLCVSNLVMMVLVVPFSLTTVFLNRHDAYSKAACQVSEQSQEWVQNTPHTLQSHRQAIWGKRRFLYENDVALLTVYRVSWQILDNFARFHITTA